MISIWEKEEIIQCKKSGWRNSRIMKHFGIRYYAELRAILLEGGAVQKKASDLEYESVFAEYFQVFYTAFDMPIVRENTDTNLINLCEFIRNHKAINKVIMFTAVDRNGYSMLLNLKHINTY